MSGYAKRLRGFVVYKIFGFLFVFSIPRGYLILILCTLFFLLTNFLFYPPQKCYGAIQANVHLLGIEGLLISNLDFIFGCPGLGIYYPLVVFKKDSLVVFLVN